MEDAGERGHRPVWVWRQLVYSRRARYAAGESDGLREVSQRPRTSPSRLSAEVEALVCELRRAQFPVWLCHVPPTGLPSYPRRPSRLA
jgi:hypothetical protein